MYLHTHVSKAGDVPAEGIKCIIRPHGTAKKNTIAKIAAPEAVKDGE